MGLKNVLGCREGNNPCEMLKGIERGRRGAKSLKVGESAENLLNEEANGMESKIQGNSLLSKRRRELWLGNG